MLTALWREITSEILKILPGIVLRLLIRPGHVSRDFEVDLRSSSPIEVSLSSMVPFLRVWFRYTNKSAVSVRVDRAVCEVWIGQPLADGAILECTEVKPKETVETVRFESKLSGLQKSIISQRLHTEKRLRATVKLYIVCECEIGRFEIRRNLEGTVME